VWRWKPFSERGEPDEGSPVTGRIVHIADDGTQTDVTEGVQALYDLATGSMDFGSGFWTFEDALPVARIARLCGFSLVEEVERYVREKQRDRSAPPRLLAAFLE